MKARRIYIDRCLYLACDDMFRQAKAKQAEADALDA
jgi:hypothetical protein